MASMKEVLPKGDYRIKNVGPSRDWEFQGNNGTVRMTTDAVQFEGYEQFWVDVNRAQDKPAPAIGEVLTGHVEQDEAGKYAPKFVKPKGGGGGGGWRGGSQSSPGAIWATAFQTATHIVAGFYVASGSKPKDINDYFGKIEKIATKVNAAVDKLIASNTKAETKPADTVSSEAGETQAGAPASAAAPAPVAEQVVQDITSEDLGEW